MIFDLELNLGKVLVTTKEYNIRVKASGYCTCLSEAMMQSQRLLGICLDPGDQWKSVFTFACGVMESTHTF